MTESSEYELVEALGEAASHEHAAGWIGYHMKDKLQDSLHGPNVAQKHLPDLQSMQPHLDEYTAMLDEIGYDSGNHTSADLAAEYEQMLPEGDASPEYGLVVAGFLENEAEQRARVALEKAQNTSKGQFYQSSIEAIGRDEQGEAQEVKDLLHGEFNWDEREDVSFDELTSVENVQQVAERL